LATSIFLACGPSRKKEHQEKLLCQQRGNVCAADKLMHTMLPNMGDDSENGFVSHSMHMFWEQSAWVVQEFKKVHTSVLLQQHIARQVLEINPKNRFLLFLASSSSNFAIDWQQGRFIGACAFSLVYSAINLE
jgi:mitogen-activated protein kinase kinase kinase